MDGFSVAEVERKGIEQDRTSVAKGRGQGSTGSGALME